MVLHLLQVCIYNAQGKKSILTFCKQFEEPLNHTHRLADLKPAKVGCHCVIGKQGAVLQIGEQNLCREGQYYPRASSTDFLFGGSGAFGSISSIVTFEWICFFFFFFQVLLKLRD